MDHKYLFRRDWSSCSDPHGEVLERMTDYLIPMILFFAGYALGTLWNLGALVGCLSFAVSICLAVVYDRKVVQKRETVYTITKYAGK